MEGSRQGCRARAVPSGTSIGRARGRTVRHTGAAVAPAVAPAFGPAVAPAFGPAFGTAFGPAFGTAVAPAFGTAGRGRRNRPSAGYVCRVAGSARPGRAHA